MFFRYNWPGLLWMLVILILTGIPGNYVPGFLDFREWLEPDKIVHILIFGVFTFLLLHGFRKQYRFKVIRYHYVLFSLLFGIVLGLSTEVLQIFIFSGRHGNIYDFAANTAGCLAGWGFFEAVNGKLKLKN